MLKRAFLWTIVVFCASYSITISDIEGEWEVVKQHNILYRPDDTLGRNVDTVIIKEHETELYVFTEDTIHIYDYDYEDSRERDCYMWWSEPYELTSDSTFNWTSWPQHENDPGVHIMYKLKFSNDTLIYTFQWFEDEPYDVYQQTKIYYLVPHSGPVPPDWWPNAECHGRTHVPAVIPSGRTRTAELKCNGYYNLLGKRADFGRRNTAQGLIIFQGSKQIFVRHILLAK